MVALGEVCEVIAGQSPPGHTYNRDGKGLPFFQGKTDFGEHYPVPRMWCTEPNKIALPGDLLISVRAPVGPTNLCDTQACIGRGIASIRPSEKVDVRYLMHWMRSIEPQVAALGRGSTFEAISKSDLVKVLIPLPPLPEQRRIAAILDKAQALVANDKRTLAVYDQLAKSLFLEMFGDPVRNERGWEYRDLGAFTSRIVVGHVGPTSFGYADAGIPYLRTMNVRVNEVDRTDVKYITEAFHRKLKKSVIHTDDVLISRVGVNRGMAAPCPKDLDGANCGNIIVVGHTPKLDSVFLSHYLNLTFGQGASFGYSVGSAQGVVNTANVKKWPIINVPVHEQERFAKASQEIQRSRSQVEASLRQSEALFGSLLQGAFSGGLG